MRTLLVAFIALLVFSVPALADNSETIANGAPPNWDPQTPGELFDWNRTTLYDTGNLFNCPDCGGAGIDWSELQDATLMDNVYGFGCAIGSNFKLADDFIIPDGQEWHITAITVFAYQTGSTLQSTLNDAKMVIYDTLPGDNTQNIIYGDWTTNVLAATAWTSVYRTLESAPGATNRPIMSATCAVDVTLGPGQYWIGFTLGGTLSSGPWGPPQVIRDVCDTGDGLQDTGTGFAFLQDSGNFCMKGLPFMIEGDMGGVATENTSWGAIKGLYR
jgi:hypothetical protein